MMESNVVEFRSRVFECPDCGSNQVDTVNATDRFQYGTGPKAVELEAVIPFRKCKDCGFEYTDAEAEDLRHAAVCRHLGVYQPSEVVDIRKRYGLTQAEFAERTKIGAASL